MTSISLESPLFCFEEGMSGKSMYELAKGRAVLCAMASPERPGKSQDSAALIPVDAKSGVLVVADGVGGHRDGALASRKTVEKLYKAVREETADGQELRKAILDGIENANQAVLDIGSGAATTLSVLEIRDRTVRSYHVGDSLILLVGGRGRLKFYTVPHSPVGYAVEAGYLNDKEALHHKERHLVSNVVGSAEMKIEIGPELTLDPLDKILLATDGLSDNLSTEEIVGFVHKGELKAIVKNLAEACRNRMLHPVDGKPSKPDDMTFILFRLR